MGPIEELGERSLSGRRAKQPIIAAHKNRIVAVALSDPESEPRRSTVVKVLSAALDPSVEGENQLRDPRPWLRRRAAGDPDSPASVRR